MSKSTTRGLVRRGEVWHIDKQVKGRRISESTGTANLSEAERYLARRMEELRRFTVYGERPTVTVREACAKFLADYCPPKSLERRARALEWFMPFIGTLDITLLHDGSLNDYRQSRRAAGITAGTINLELSVLARVLNLAARVWRHENGRAYLDTAPLLTRDKGEARKPYPLSWDEQRRLFAPLTARFATLCEFAVNTGLRSSEVRGLRWEWRVRVPELDTCVFILPATVTKTGVERVIVLNETAKRIVEQRDASGESPDYVFVTEAAKPWSTNWASWRRVTKAQGIPARIHDLRHTFGHRLRAAGVDVETRADLLGHASGRMTTHYSAPDLERLIAAANAIVLERPSTILRAVPQESRKVLAGYGK